MCYERLEHDSKRAKVWKYEVVVKGQSRVGHLIHYILARNIYDSYSIKRPHEVVMLVRHSVREARTCIRSLVKKVQSDSEILKDAYDLIKPEDIQHGK